MRYSASTNNLNLKTGLGVFQGHWKWRHSMDHIWLSIGQPTAIVSSIALSGTDFKLFDIE